MKRCKLPLLITLIVLGTAIIGANTAYAKTKRMADVQVKNNTGRDIESVTVIHKYSNEYKHSQTWGNLPNGATTTMPLTVEYNTGFGTTGRDWWIIIWRYKGDESVYFTDPLNLRSIIDGLEKALISVIDEIGAAVAKEAGASKDGEVIAGEAAKQLGALFLNTESTAGFKQHILRQEDEGTGNATVIEIRADEVTFTSKSGKSTAGNIGKK